MGGERKIEFIEQISRTETIKSFRFRSEGKIDFYAGQFAQIVFDDENSSNKDLNKYLSFSCAPDKNYLEFTKRITQSLFSRRLLNLVKGSKIKIRGPLGKCTLSENVNKVCFLAGGIGITPVISMLEYSVEERTGHDLCLLYSNRSTNDIAFKPQIDRLSTSPLVRTNYTVIDCELNDATCYRGFIDKNLITSKVKDYMERFFYIFGPPPMVEAMKTICKEINVPNNQTRVESFIGY